jgi:hypothetical protein
MNEVGAYFANASYVVSVAGYRGDGARATRVARQGSAEGTSEIEAKDVVGAAEARASSNSTSREEGWKSHTEMRFFGQ